MIPVRLIKKYGTRIKRNGVDVVVFFDEEKASSFKKAQNFKQYTGFKISVLLMKGKAQATDVFNYDGKDYRVFEAKTISSKGTDEYTEAVVFQDDFNHDLKIYDQAMGRNGLSLPIVSQGDDSFISVKARIATATPNDYKNLAFHGGKVPSHIFTLISTEQKPKVSDLIKWGDRRFEILSVEELNEAGVLIVIEAIEVLR